MNIETFKQKFQSYSGLALVFFVLIHLIGLVYAGISPDGFEIYASSLHSNTFLPYLEIALSLTFIIHISLTLEKVLKNRFNGNKASLRTRRKDYIGVLSSRIQPFSGLILFLFLIIHLFQLRFPRPSNNMELVSLKENLKDIDTMILYSLASISIFFHMVHGIESGHRSSGILIQSNALKIRSIGRLISVFFGLSFLILTFYFRLY